MESGELARLRALYEGYLTEAEAAERSAAPGAGLFGFGKGPEDDPCHDRFVAALRAFYEELAILKTQSGTVRELMEYACAAPRENPRPRSAYWMLIAVQGLTIPLAERLNPADAGALAELYEKSCRRSERLPVQKQLIDALRAAAKE